MSCIGCVMLWECIHVWCRPCLKRLQRKVVVFYVKNWRCHKISVSASCIYWIQVRRLTAWNSWLDGRRSRYQTSFSLSDSPAALYSWQPSVLLMTSDSHFHLVLRLGVNGAISPLLCVPSWHAWGQLDLYLYDFFYFNIIKEFFKEKSHCLAMRAVNFS
jgi:hypothetical protein